MKFGNTNSKERLTDFRPIEVVESIEKNIKIFKENLQFQKKRFSGLLGSIKRNYNLVHLFDVFLENDEFDTNVNFDSNFLAHCYQEAWDESYKSSKRNLFKILKLFEIFFLLFC